MKSYHDTCLTNPATGQVCLNHDWRPGDVDSRFKTTIEILQAYGACKRGMYTLLEGLNTLPFPNRKVTLSEILYHNGLSDALWALRVMAVQRPTPSGPVGGCMQDIEEFAIYMAECTLPAYEESNGDELREALWQARRCAAGRITEEQKNERTHVLYEIQDRIRDSHPNGVYSEHKEWAAVRAAIYACSYHDKAWVRFILLDLLEAVKTVLGPEKAKLYAVRWWRVRLGGGLEPPTYGEEEEDFV